MYCISGQVLPECGPQCDVIEKLLCADVIMVW